MILRGGYLVKYSVIRYVYPKITLFSYDLLQPHFLYQAMCAGVLFNHEKHITNVNYNAAGSREIGNVTTYLFPIAVEVYSNQPPRPFRTDCPSAAGGVGGGKATAFDRRAMATDQNHPLKSHSFSGTTNSQLSGSSFSITSSKVVYDVNHTVTRLYHLTIGKSQ